MRTAGELTENIADYVLGAQSPVTSKQIADVLMKSNAKRDIEIVDGILEQLTRTKRIHMIPPERAGLKPRFSKRTAMEIVADRILDVMRTGSGRMTIKQLREQLRKWESKFFDESLGKLIREKKLFYLTVRFKYVLTFPPTPSDHLLPRQMTDLKEILDRINRHRKLQITLPQMLSFLNEAAPAHTQEESKSVSLSEDLFREWYKQDLRDMKGLSTIPLDRTWSRYASWCGTNSMHPSIDEFKLFLAGLKKLGKVELVPHSMSHGMSEQLRKLSLNGEHGEILSYWRWR